MNKLKILQIHDYSPFEGGGIEVNVSKVSAEMVRLGHEVKIATPRIGAEGAVGNQVVLERDGVQAVRLVSLIQLQQLIDAADVVNVHFTFSCHAAAMNAMEYCSQIGKKCIVNIRTGYEHIPFTALSKLPALEKDALFIKVRALFASPYIVLSAPSSCIRDSLQWLGVDKELTVIHNGTALQTQEVTQQLEKVDVTFLGRIAVLKGVQYLLESVMKLKAQFPHLKVRLLGGGIEMAYFQQQAAALELNDNVEFVGHVPHAQVVNYLAATRVHVHPSLTEVWPGAILESLAMGNTVVAADVGGIAEMTENGKHAYLFPKGDTQKLTEILTEVLSKPGPELNVAAQEYVTDRFTIVNQTQQVLNFYNQIYVSK
jgi:glycosyltransferase involved in cell wall biosynthesis